jgi:GxxExxY protein
MIELLRHGIKAEKQKPIKVFYIKHIVGEYFADIVVEDTIILE